VGLKLGADASLRAKQARLTTPYDRRKNIVTNGAIALRLPINKMHYSKKKKQKDKNIHSNCSK